MPQSMGQSKQSGDWWLDTAAPHGHYCQIFPYVSLEWITRTDAMTNIILIKETLWVLCTNQQDAAKTHRYLFPNQMAANAKADIKTLVNNPGARTKALVSTLENEPTKAPCCPFSNGVTLARKLRDFHPQRILTMAPRLRYLHQQMFLMLAAIFRDLDKGMTLILAPRLQVFIRCAQKP